MRLFTRVPDRPGGLAELLNLIAEARANLVSLEHLREGVPLHVRETGVELTLETRGPGAHRGGARRPRRRRLRGRARLSAVRSRARVRGRGVSVARAPGVCQSGPVERFQLSGRVALVTGGARGIGFATARALLARGASVTIVDLDPDAVARAAAELHDSRALGLVADVTDRGAMQRVVAETAERFGGLDVVVANAGIASRVATFRATPPETFERVLEVNLMGVVRTVDAALPQIIERRGHVVVISSIYAFTLGIAPSPTR